MKKENHMPFEVRHAKKLQTGTLLSSIGAALSLCFMALAGAASTVLSILSIFSTALFKIDSPMSGVSPAFPSVTEELIFRYGLPSLRFIAGFVGLVAGILIIATLVRGIPRHRIAQFVTIFSLVASMVWVLSLNACGGFWYNDSRSLVDSAGAFLNGDLPMFEPTAPDHGEGSPRFYLYYSWYPFQTGAMLWFTLVFAITGVGNIAGFQIINAVLSAGIAWAIWKIGERCGIGDGALRCTAVLLVLCIPLFTSSSFVYPNSAGLFLILVALLLGIQAMRSTSTKHIIALTIAAYLVATAAMMVKGTEVIFVIALTLTMVTTALLKRRYWLIVLSCFLFMLSHVLSSLSVTIVEMATGQNFGGGLPQLSWIAIGLDVNSDALNPGWWSGSALDAYKQTGGDPSAQSAMAVQSIMDSLTTFLQNPGRAFEFFRDKLAGEWSEPTFASFYYAHLTETQAPGRIAVTMFGSAYDRIISFENVYQSVTYIFATVGIIASIVRWKRSDNDTNIGMTLLSLCFLGGFGCFLLWEAKSMYTLPFFLILIPSAASGLNMTAHLCGTAYARISAMLRKRDGDPQEA